MKLLNIIFVINTMVIWGQSEIVWQKDFGGSQYNSPYNMVSSPDSQSSFLVFSTTSPISFDQSEASHGDSDFWLVKIDADGNILWNKTFGGTDTEAPANKSIIYNSKLYIAGSSASVISGNKTAESYGDYDYWLLCLDLDGTIIWQKTYGGSGLDLAKDLTINANGNLVVMGHSNSAISGNKTENAHSNSFDYWVLEVSPTDGSILKQKTIGSNGLESASNVHVIGNNYYLVGTSENGASGDKTDVGYGSSDCWIAKLDSNFNLVQNKCFGGSSYVENVSSKTNQNNIYLISSTMSSISGNKTSSSYGGLDIWYFKLDADLNKSDDYSFGGDVDDYGNDLLIRANGDVLLFGSANSGISGNKEIANYGQNDAWLVVLNSNNVKIHEKVYGGSSSDSGVDLIEQNNEIKLLIGTSSGISGNKTVPAKGLNDGWLVNVDGSALVGITENSISNFSVFPNPTNGIINLKSDFASNNEAVITDINGRLIQTFRISKNTQELDLSTFENGVYFIHYNNTTVKIVKS